MSYATDAKIMQLFELAATTQDEFELNKIAKQLRAAITEHSRFGPIPAQPEVSSADRTVGYSEIRTRTRTAS